MPVDTVLEWEALPAAEMSPGPVQDSERLYRQLLDPVHWNAGAGELKPDAFCDVERIGLSVNRIEHSSLDALEAAAETRVSNWNRDNPNKPARKFIGFAVFECGDVRAQLCTPEGASSSTRLFAVFDTARQNDESHADVCRVDGGGYDKYHKVRAKAILWELGNRALELKRENSCS